MDMKASYKQISQLLLLSTTLYSLLNKNYIIIA